MVSKHTVQQHAQACEQGHAEHITHRADLACRQLECFALYLLVRLRYNSTFAAQNLRLYLQIWYFTMQSAP